MSSYKIPIFPWCTTQSGEGRNINHHKSAFPSLVGYNLTNCQLWNSESLCRTPHSLHLCYTKQSLSRPISVLLHVSTRSLRSTPSWGKSNLFPLVPGALGLILTPEFWLRGTGEKYWLEVMMNTQEKLCNTKCAWLNVMLVHREEKKSYPPWHCPTCICTQEVSKWLYPKLSHMHNAPPIQS